MLGFGLKKERTILADHIKDSFRYCINRLHAEPELSTDYETKCELLYFCAFCSSLAIHNSRLGGADQHRLYLYLNDYVNYIIAENFVCEQGYSPPQTWIMPHRLEEAQRMLSQMQARVLSYKSSFDIDASRFSTLNKIDMDRSALYKSIFSNVVRDRNCSTTFMEFLFEHISKGVIALRKH